MSGSSSEGAQVEFIYQVKIENGKLTKSIAGVYSDAYSKWRSAIAPSIAKCPDLQLKERLEKILSKKPVEKRTYQFPNVAEQVASNGRKRNAKDADLSSE